MSDVRPMDGSALEPRRPPGDPLSVPAAPPGDDDGHPGGGDAPRAPVPEPRWPAWTAPVALVGGVVLAAVGGLIVDIPALAAGVTISPSHTPPGIAIANTFVQDIAFVAAAVYCAQLGGRGVRAWQLGLRPPADGWRSAVKAIAVLLVLFLVFSAVWAAVFNPSKEKLLEQLGSNEGSGLLILSAGLTCVVAPICEEILFRGFIFTALRSWRGPMPAAIITGVLFGAVHAGSAPAIDLVPLAALGVGLCLLYRHTGSLYPCFVAHSLNNSIAFAALENWGWQVPVLVVGALAGIWAVVYAAKRIGLIAPETSVVGPAA